MIEFHKTYSWITRAKDVPSLIRAGQVWVPVTAHRITPDLAELRKIARVESGIKWPDEACIPAYVVRYVPQGSALVGAVGRL